MEWIRWAFLAANLTYISYSGSLFWASYEARHWPNNPFFAKPIDIATGPFMNKIWCLASTDNGFCSLSVTDAFLEAFTWMMILVHVLQMFCFLSANLKNLGRQSVLFLILEVQDPEKRMELLLDLCVDEGIRQSKTVYEKLEVYQFRRSDELRQHWLKRLAKK